MSPTFSLLVPVKTLALAKSRLGDGDPADSGRRPVLMRAFALDALEAARACRAVTRLYVVTDERGFDLDGVQVLPDEGAGDLNAVIRTAAVHARLRDPSNAVATMCADLPSLRSADLAGALTGSLSPRWFVADAAGTGTTLLAAGPGVDLDPHFGQGSARRHEDSGAARVRADLPSLRLDVDTDQDLSRAETVGVGVHTAAALATRAG